MSLIYLRTDLVTNDLVQDLKWDARLRDRFATGREGVLAGYPLSAAEVTALREQDFGALYRMGVHPYLLSQLARLYRGTDEKAGSSAAATALLKSLWGEEYEDYMRRRGQA